VCLLLSAFCTSYAESEPDVLRIGRFAYSAPRKVLISHHPLMLFLAKETGVKKVELQLYLTYEEIHAALMRGELDLGWLGTAFYALTDEKNYTPLVTPVWNKTPYYVGHIIARADSGFKDLSDLIGHSMAFVSESSSSGYIFPSLLLKKHGIELSQLREYAFLRSHDAVAYAVLTRQYEAGAAYKGVLELETFRNEKEQFQILGETEKIWNEPLVMRDSFPESLRTKLQQAFLTAYQADALSTVEGLDGFAPITDSDYDGVRSLLRLIPVEKDKQEGRSD
jgi:phosphonate transport system substrate-binding protein